jgi:hypothetical protein
MKKMPGGFYYNNSFFVLRLYLTMYLKQIYVKIEINTKS